MPLMNDLPMRCSLRHQTSHSLPQVQRYPRYLFVFKNKGRCKLELATSIVADLILERHGCYCNRYLRFHPSLGHDLERSPG